jgi:hypothetical protein
LRVGGKITWHFDDFAAKTKENIYRLHVPVTTATGNIQILSHELYFWDRGEVWLGDYRFPHMVVNASHMDRVHLIIDLLPNKSLRSSINDLINADWFGAERTLFAHSCQDMLNSWRRRDPP